MTLCEKAPVPYGSVKVTAQRLFVAALHETLCPRLSDPEVLDVHTTYFHEGTPSSGSTPDFTSKELS
jgi:hypothetical protein